METVGLLLLILLVALLWRHGVSRGEQPAQRARQGGPTRSQAEPQVLGSASSGYYWDVVGESFQADSFRAILGARAGGEGEWLGRADLVLEDDNPADPDAVRVDVHGRCVGHLPKKNARRFRKLLEASEPGSVTWSAPCRVYEGGENFRFSVALDIPNLPWRS